MPKQTASEESLNFEFLEYQLRDWAETMWKENNKDKFPENRIAHEFINRWAAGDRGLSFGERVKERGFETYIGLAIDSVGFVSEKALDKLTDNSLVNAWRKSVWQNNFRSRYNMLEETLRDYIAANGTAAAIAKFPKNDVVSAEAMAQTLEYMNYKPKIYDTAFMAELIRRSQPAAPEAPKAAPAPK